MVQLCLFQFEATSSIWVSHMDSKDSSVWTTVLCFPKSISKKLDSKQNRWDLNWHSGVRHQQGLAPCQNQEAYKGWTLADADTWGMIQQMQDLSHIVSATLHIKQNRKRKAESLRTWSCTDLTVIFYQRLMYKFCNLYLILMTWDERSNLSIWEVLTNGALQGLIFG